MRWPSLILSLLLPLSAAGAVPSPHAIDIPKWFSESFLDMREDVREAAREKKRLMVYFGQDGCPYCKALMKVTFGQPDIASRTQRQFVAVALNIWGDREVAWIDGRTLKEKDLAVLLRVQYTPTLLFFDEQANVVLRLDGYVPPEKFRPALDYVGGRMESKLSYADFVAGLPPGKAGAGLVAQPFFERGAVDVPALLASGKPVVAVFERKACGDCAEMHRDAFARPDVRRELGRFRAVQVDILGGRRVVAQDRKAMTEREWARALQVINTPSFVFFDVAGKEVFRADGYLRPYHLASVLDYVASGAYREEPSFQRFIQKRADAQRARGNEVDLWK